MNFKQWIEAQLTMDFDALPPNNPPSEQELQQAYTSYSDKDFEKYIQSKFGNDENLVRYAPQFKRNRPTSSYVLKNWLYERAMENIKAHKDEILRVRARTLREPDELPVKAWDIIKLAKNLTVAENGWATDGKILVKIPDDDMTLIRKAEEKRKQEYGKKYQDYLQKKQAHDAKGYVRGARTPREPENRPLIGDKSISYGLTKWLQDPKDPTKPSGRLLDLIRAKTASSPVASVKAKQMPDDSVRYILKDGEGNESVVDAEFYNTVKQITGGKAYLPVSYTPEERLMMDYPDNPQMRELMKDVYKEKVPHDAIVFKKDNQPVGVVMGLDRDIDRKMS